MGKPSAHGIRPRRPRQRFGICPTERRNSAPSEHRVSTPALSTAEANAASDARKAHEQLKGITDPPAAQKRYGIGPFPTGDYKLPNLRTTREHLTSSWSASQGGLYASVTPIDLPVDRVRRLMQWRLRIELNVPGKQWQLLAVRPTSRDETISNVTPEPSPRAGPRTVSVDIAVPPDCSPADNRKPVTIEATFRVGDETKTVRLDVDTKYLLGDFVYQPQTAKTHAVVAHQHLHEASINALVERAEKLPRVSLARELERLKGWITFHFQRDPSSIDQTFSKIRGDAAPYSLTPTETLRYGGQCSDWTALLSAYLVRRGFKVTVAYAPGHVWLLVAEPWQPNRWTPVDWVGSAARDNATPYSTAPVIGDNTRTPPRNSEADQ